MCYQKGSFFYYFLTYLETGAQPSVVPGTQKPVRKQKPVQKPARKTNDNVQNYNTGSLHSALPETRNEYLPDIRGRQLPELPYGNETPIISYIPGKFYYFHPKNSNFRACNA